MIFARINGSQCARKPFIHFPAAYLPEVKRVAFIGGGDSMLLHEALKYPDIELVLGLELDQQVVRESFWRFQARPHFDDPRVQWWFGDAARSLTLLPREWFGTFDLVLVDLSETAMSITVNEDLDIFGALALLVRPEGILVKNEDYFSRLSKYLDHSVSVNLVGVPEMCDQDWGMASNRADFLRPNLAALRERGVQTLEYVPDDEDAHYRMILDYSRNDARQQGACDDYDAEALHGKKPQERRKEEPVKPVASSGVLLVADADNATEPLDLGRVVAALKAVGMTPLEQSLFLPSGDHRSVTPSLFIGMEEGYVAAHSYPGTSSIGIDILLWSKLGTQTDVLQSLLDVIGIEKSYSSFRVIHGGMNGHKNWKEEMNTKGPVKKNTRDCSEEASAFDPEESTSKISTDHFGTVVAESMSLLPEIRRHAVAVLCGTKGVDPCATLGALKHHPRVHARVAIWTCPDVDRPDEDVYADEADKTLSHVYACGEEGISRSADAEGGFSALVLDPAAPTDLAAMLAATFCDKDGTRRPHLREQVALILPLSNDAERRALHACRRRLSPRNVRAGTVVLDDAAAVGIAVAANDGFVGQLVTIAARVEEALGRPTEVRRIQGSAVRFQDDFAPIYHSADAYDQQEALQQYAHQMPLASQSIYQLEIQHEEEVDELSSSLAKEILDFVTSESEPKRLYFEVGDGSVAVAFAPAGYIIVTWNGAATFTINTLTGGEDYGVQPNNNKRYLTLLGHANVIDRMKDRLPASTTIASREQMPRGANRVVNFKYDTFASSNCADYYSGCKYFAFERKCSEEQHQQWMHQYCSLSCETCDEMAKVKQ